MDFASKYNPRRVDGLSCPEDTLTQQHFENEVNINMIMARYNRTGLFPQCTEPMNFEDVSTVGDFHSIQNRLALAKENFMKLPSDMRKRFNNSAVELLDFLADAKNRAEAEKLGLVNPSVSHETKVGEVKE